MKHVTKGKTSANKTSGLDTRTTASKDRYEPLHLGQIKAALSKIGWILARYTEQEYYKSNTQGFGLYQLVFEHKEANQQFIIVSGNNTETLAGIYTGLAGIPFVCLYSAKHDRSYTDYKDFEKTCLGLAQGVLLGSFPIKSELTSEDLHKAYQIACFYKNETKKGIYCSYPELADQFDTIHGFFTWFFNPGNSKMKLDRIIRIRDIAVNSYRDLRE